MVRLIRSVEYFQDVNVDILHKLLYGMRTLFFEKDSFILKQGDFTDRILFIESGTAEVLTEFESNEFVIERLGQGAVINRKAFWVNDLMQVYIKCVTNTSVLYLDAKVLDELKETYPDFNRKLLLVENGFLKSGKAYPLDYSQPAWVPNKLPPNSNFKSLKEKKLYEVERLRRESILKNVVFR